MDWQKAVRLLAFLILLASCGLAQTTEKHKQLQSTMYNIIRSMAYPSAKFGVGNVTQRFVMQIPGKPLNYRDYYPGDAYVEALKRVGENEAPEVTFTL